MSHPTPSQPPDTDRNLLFGVLALQVDLIDSQQFVEICNVWAGRKTTALPDLLIERGWLSPDDRNDVDRLLERKLLKHGQDAKAGLDEIATPAVRHSLAALNDDAIRASLAEPVTVGEGPAATEPYVSPRRERFRLNRLHAVGGIGQVWLAHDDDLGRDVALKELRSDRTAHPAYSERFVQEARITGQLEHPGIVPIYELGRRPDGPPFYVMRFLKGRTLSKAGADHRQERETGAARAVDFRALLQAFVAVCNAVAYAHSRGVLHRDLKGQNILLGDFGEVVVLDWGLAKRLGSSDSPTTIKAAPGGTPLETLEGEVLGTPGYMAPEQAAGHLEQIDQRTDVYGLGAVLYELLTGQPPHTGTDKHEVLRRVREEAPPRPRTFWPGAPPALEAICLRALARDPAQRYPAAADLARDVERWLADESVAVFREPLSTRVSRWGRRHRQTVATAAALLVTAVVALGVSNVLISQQKARADNNFTLAAAETRRAEANSKRAEDNYHTAETEREAAVTARGRAETNFQRARLAVDLLLTRVSEDETFLANEPHLEHLRRRLLQDAVEFYRTFLEEKSSDPAVRLETTFAHRRLGNLLQELGEHNDAEKEYLSAGELARKLDEEFPATPVYLQELGGIYNSLGILYRSLSQLQQARAAFAAAIGFKKRLADAVPGVPDYYRDLATSWENQTQVLRALGTFDEAQAASTEAIHTWEQLLDRFGVAPDVVHRLGVSLTTLAGLLEDRGEQKERLVALDRAVALLDPVASAAPETPFYQRDLAVCLHNRGIVRREMKQFDAAEKDQRRALDIRRKLAAEHADVPGNWHYLSISLRSWGLLQLERGRHADAQTALEEAGQIQQRLMDQHALTPLYRQDFGITCVNLGLVLFKRLQFKEAETASRQGIEAIQPLIERYPGVPDYLHLLGTLQQNLAASLLARLEPALASEQLAQAIHWQVLALRMNPQNRIYQQCLRHHLSVRAAVLVGLRDYREAAALAHGWVEVLPDRWEDAYDSGRTLAKSMILAAQDDKLDASRRQQLVKQFGDEAVSVLREAVKRGFRDSDKLSRETDLEPLRDRPDFKQLQAELKKGNEKP